MRCSEKPGSHARTVDTTIHHPIHVKLVGGRPGFEPGFDAARRTCRGVTQTEELRLPTYNRLPNLQSTSRIASTSILSDDREFKKTSSQQECRGHGRFPPGGRFFDSSEYSGAELTNILRKRDPRVECTVERKGTKRKTGSALRTEAPPTANQVEMEKNLCS